MTTEEKLQRRIQQSVDFAKEENEYNETADWNYQQGVLLDYKEAEYIVGLIDNAKSIDNAELLEALKKSDHLFSELKRCCIFFTSAIEINYFNGNDFDGEEFEEHIDCLMEENKQLFTKYEQFKKCGQGDNVCNCKSLNECGYLPTAEEAERENCYCTSCGALFELECCCEEEEDDA